jgi:hypothetical protein
VSFLFACSTVCAAQTTRYFKAEHGVAATYLRLGANGQYSVIDREHMGVLITDEGRWLQTGAVIRFTPKDTKKQAFEVTENKHSGKSYLEINSEHASAGIAIPALEIDGRIDADPKYLPDHVLFEVSAKTFETETKQTYPFRYIGKEQKRK